MKVKSRKIDVKLNSILLNVKIIKILLFMIFEVRSLAFIKVHCY